ncbi:cytosolic phospholipase A2 gamma-like protein [Labeo rohita]|uniref:Cytosolic phospholipase A2 gamma-like protein n=1 Tax=Labeo rohita TaxID=84645 RepID=A0A498LZ85_LABRO|nr:cytosolic phospholipase A2 gamma-like protein [Labeo rohita]
MEESKSLEDEVRIKHSLNKKEEEFVVKRREAVFQSLQKLKIHCSQDAVPHIALLGSGGGQRAMVAFLETLVELDKAGLLDCILYLSGVSGSTWCMASLDQEPDWSTKLKIVKDKIIKRLSGPRVSLRDALAKLKKYYYENDIFSLTDVWAVMAITEYVKEIDEHTLTDQQDQHNKDPLLIYTVIDVQSKQCRDGDPWFEISPYEAGYSLTGAFVKTSSFGSQFDNGYKIKNQPEMDMLYLQALCGSSFADGEENKKFIWKQIRDFFNHSLRADTGMFEEIKKDSNCPPVDKCSQVLMDLADMNLSVLNGIDPRALDESFRKTLNVRETTDTCKKQNIPFPEVNIPNVEVQKQKDFYVFKGQNAPTVILISLFNVVSCGEEVETWRNKYCTRQSSYSAEMITDLMEVAGKNISNNREKLKEEIHAVVEQKRSKQMKLLTV